MAIRPNGMSNGEKNGEQEADQFLGYEPDLSVPIETRILEGVRSLIETNKGKIVGYHILVIQKEGRAESLNAFVGTDIETSVYAIAASVAHSIYTELHSTGQDDKYIELFFAAIVRLIFAVFRDVFDKRASD